VRLSDFIRTNTESILSAWEAFAATMFPAAAGMTSSGLRDHAPQILDAIARDLDTAQTREQQSLKSRGLAVPISARETAAQTHAVLRARSGFDITQLAAEYRALRASVLRLWMDAAVMDETGVQDIIRFNEAIDQAVAESVGHFHVQVETARNLLLGMLGHDLRSPLNTVVATASYLAALNAGEQVSAAAGRLIRSGASMQALLADLVDFNRTNFGLGIRVVPSHVALAKLLEEEVEQLRWAHPRCRIDWAAAGDCRGWWDGLRLQQALRNLVSNAITHCVAATPVGVRLHGDALDLRLSVTNRGEPIDAAMLGAIFDPLKQGVAAGGRPESGSLGLGLFIVREIARAHGGDVEVRCGDGATTFTVRLPRRRPDAR